MLSLDEMLKGVFNDIYLFIYSFIYLFNYLFICSLFLVDLQLMK